MEAQITQGRWYVHEKTKIYAPGGIFVADTFPLRGERFGLDESEAEANAAHIVACVSAWPATLFESATGNARRLAVAIGLRATRYDSGFGTVDYTCDKCGQKAKSRALPPDWSDEGGNRHRCPGCQQQNWPYQLACETCPATVGYGDGAGDGSFESRVIDGGWMPESDVTGGVLCPACTAKWLDADGLLKPGAPVRTASAARRIAERVQPGPTVRPRDELSRKMEFPLIRDFVWTGEDLNPWRCGSCATARQRAAAEGMAEAELEPPRCCRKCGVSF